MTTKTVNLFILGVQKAGTTALASFLSQHDEICVVDNKEAHVFDDPDYFTAINKKSFADSKYAALLPDSSSTHRYYCDATPITLFNPNYLKECVSYNPKAKYIVILRDPVDRAFSQYEMSKNKGIETHCASFAFLRDILLYSNCHKAKGIWPFESSPREKTYLSRGRYIRQLNDLFALVQRQNVLVLWQQDLLHSHQETLHQVLLFLGLQQTHIKKSQVFEGAQTVSRVDRWIGTLIAKSFYLCKRETLSRLNARLNNLSSEI